ncbi:MAG: YqaE/Pmp3 family membrane protein [Amphritea sp.]|nr:YqaE/Pmp3 family membrane protein [Amphritea sp.]
MDNKLVLIILAILLPPIAVFMKAGVGLQLVINIVLCLFFYIPGIIHALWLALK